MGLRHVTSGLALLVGLMSAAGCRGRPGPASAPTAAAPAKVTAKPPATRSGFVVYTVDDSGAASTWLVPYTLSDTLTTEPARRLDGWWVQDDEPARVTVWSRGDEEDGWTLPEAMTSRLWDARCPPGGAAGAGGCTWPPTQAMTVFDGDGRVREQKLDEHACACFDLPVADRAVFLAGEFDDAAYLDDGSASDDDEETCEMAYQHVDAAIVAMLGGMLQSFTSYSILDCDGARAEDLSLETESLAIRAALPKVAMKGDEWFCRVSDPEGLDWVLPERFEDQAESEAESDSEGEDEEHCNLDDEIWSVRRGRLVKTEIGTDLLSSCVCHSWMAVRPKLCPSPADVCGRATAFPELVDSQEEFWVASDERAALVLDGTIVAAGGRLRADVEDLLVGGDSARILGVRHHAWIDPLVHASAVAVEDPAPSWLPVALQWPSVVAPPAPALAPGDRARVERRGGRDWGNRCFSHFKAKRFDVAEAACAQGLAVATDPEIRGTIFHSLGRIAEARGDEAVALVYYRTSLALREDEATAKRFSRLLDPSTAIVGGRRGRR